uniref:Uncharacterized protein n=1 Tax=Panagrolaimus sp. JU765 TaxID=591449 RepID=A0AC34RA27_9BILA
MNPNKCYGCERNFTCFLQEQHKRAKLLAAGRALAWGYEDVHFFPQNWHCEMHTYFHFYKFIKYRTKTDNDYTKMLDEIKDVLISANVPNSTIKSIMDEFHGFHSTKHATLRTPERSYYEMKLKADKSAMEILVKLYYFDFVLFGFPIPDF